ncbi:MAG: AI-2E family transporter [Bacteroidota bacterium]
MENWKQILTISGAIILLALAIGMVLGFAGVIIWYFSSIFIYLGVAVVLSLIGRPIVRLLSKVKIRGNELPDTLKALITLLALFTLLFSILSFFVPLVVDISGQVSGIRVESLRENLQEPLASAKDLNTQYNFIEVPEGSTLEEELLTQFQRVIEEINVSNILSGVLGFGANFLIGLFSTTFITFYFLKERKLVHDMVMALTPDAYMERVSKVLENVKKLLTRYFVGVVLEILLVGGLVSLGLGILGVKDALFIGYFAGIFNVIPYVGPIIGGSMTATMTLLNSLQMNFYQETLPLMGEALAIFLLVQLIDNFIFQPLIYSSSVKAHPLEVFIVILMAASLGGPVGMILAIPAYTFLRVIAKEFFNQIKVVQSITRSI